MFKKKQKRDVQVNQIMRHTVGLYHGQNGANKWKRYLSDNMMARDADFQKVNHIMTIEQNNEKVSGKLVVEIFKQIKFIFFIINDNNSFIRRFSLQVFLELAEE